MRSLDLMARTFSKCTVEDVREEFGDKIKSLKKDLIWVAEDAKVEPSFPRSDLIFVFNKGRLSLITERFQRSKCSWLQWKLTSYKIRKYARSFRNSELQVSCTLHKDYLDLTHYKQWWDEWAESSRYQ